MGIALGLAVFLGVAGIVYAATAYEWRGTILLIVCAVAFLYVGLVLRGAVRRASVPVTRESMAAEEAAVESEHIGPTIWPFVVSVAALLLVVGVVGFHWVLIPGAVLFLGAGAGWFLDIKRQWTPDHPPTGPEHVSPGASALQGEQQPDDHDRR
jgi:FtsH-binding integral membrane protein